MTGGSAKSTKRADDEKAVLERIAAMPGPYRAIGERLHRLILDSAPDLRARVWYGSAGYAKEGPVLCFFRVDDYMTFGLTEKANFTPKEGAADALMPCAWFLTELDAATEARLAAIVRQATS